MEKNKEKINFKEIHKKPNAEWRKQVLQNKPLSFRPTDEQLNLLINLLTIDRSVYIKDALDMKMLFHKDPEKFFIIMARKCPTPFKRANRKVNREIKENRLIY